MIFMRMRIEQRIIPSGQALEVWYGDCSADLKY